MANANNDIVAEILAEMSDSQAPSPLSPIKSPEKRTLSDPDEDTPSSQPVPKRQKTEGFNQLRNRIASLETRRAKSLRSLTVLKEFAAKNSCPVGLQYRPRPLVRPDEQFTAAYNKICQKAEQDVLQLLIRQQQKNSSTDTETISSLKQQLNQMFPHQSKREKAEKRIQSATNRSLTRTNLSQKRPAASRKKQPKEKNELSTIKAKLNELTTLMNVFSKSENKTRVAFYPRVSFTDSSRAIPARPFSHSKKRRQKRKALKNQYKHNNDRYLKNLSDTALTDHDITLLSKGLKFIPTPPKPDSHRSLIKDFNNFTRNMRLKFLFADRNSKPHPFHVKSNWQPSPQPSVALEDYLERTKYEIATIPFSDTQDNLSAKEREALTKLRANTKVNIKRADKGNTTVVMDTQRKITEGNDQVCDTNYYTPLQEPIVASTANKVKLIVNKLYVNKHIDETTFKWLNNSQN